MFKNSNISNELFFFERCRLITATVCTYILNMRICLLHLLHLEKEQPIAWLNIWQGKTAMPLSRGTTNHNETHRSFHFYWMFWSFYRTFVYTPIFTKHPYRTNKYHMYSLWTFVSTWKFLIGVISVRQRWGF